MAATLPDVERRRGLAFVEALDVTTIEPPPIEAPEVAAGPTVSLSAWREQITSARRESVGRPGVYLDRSQTGAGKSHADLAALRLAGRGLVVLPTHENCRELELLLRSQEIDALAFPARQCEDDDDAAANCWNPEADQAEQMGLPVTPAVCVSCPHKQACRAGGYIRQMIDASEADVVIATHARAQWTGLEELGAGRAYWSIHEDAVGVLRPVAEVGEADLAAVRGVLAVLLSDPRWLDRFGGGEDEEQRAQRAAQYEFVRHLADVADWIVGQMETVDTAGRLLPPATMPQPAGIERTLFLASQEMNCAFGGRPWKALIDFAAGELGSAMVLADERFSKDDERGDHPTDEAADGGVGEHDLTECDGLVLRRDGLGRAD